MVCDVGKDAGITVFRDAVISANNTLFSCGFITLDGRYDRYFIVEISQWDTLGH